MRWNTMFITALCVIFLIKLRWPKNKSLFKKKQLIKAYFPFSNQRLSCASKNKKEQKTKYVVEWHLAKPQVIYLKVVSPTSQKFISAV